MLSSRLSPLFFLFLLPVLLSFLFSLRCSLFSLLSSQHMLHSTCRSYRCGRCFARLCTCERGGARVGSDINVNAPRPTCPCIVVYNTSSKRAKTDMPFVRVFTAHPTLEVLFASVWPVFRTCVRDFLWVLAMNLRSKCRKRWCGQCFPH